MLRQLKFLSVCIKSMVFTSAELDLRVLNNAISLRVFQPSYLECGPIINAVCCIFHNERIIGV